MSTDARARMSAKLPWIAAIIVLTVHLVGNPHYGFFRDELYFIICGLHPQFGYVDQPPVVPLLAAMTQLFGHSLILLRAIPALFAAAGVYTTCLLVTEFGGGIFALVLASIVFLFCSVLLSFGMRVGTDEVALWTWPLLALLIVRITKGADARLWLLAGAVAGITFESKYSVLFFLAALLLGVMITPERRALWNRWFVAGCGVAALVALPNALWQLHYGLPMLELLKAGQQGKNVVAGPLLYLVQEILITNLFLAPVWIVGVIWLLRTPPFRFLAFAYIALIAEMIAFHGKHYYPAAVYPIVIAAGAVAIERWTNGLTLVRGLGVVYALFFGIALVPLALPVLPEDAYVTYQQRFSEILHIPKTAIATEHGRESSALPGDWADMHGWPEMAATVAQIYDSLPPAQRAQTLVVTGNYGEASAIAFFTPYVPVVSGHNQYWLWGTHGYSGQSVIDVHGDCGASAHLFKSAKLVTRFTNRWAINSENGIAIMLCSGLKVPLASVWPSIKRYE